MTQNAVTRVVVWREVVAVAERKSKETEVREKPVVQIRYDLGTKIIKHFEALRLRLIVRWK